MSYARRLAVRSIPLLLAAVLVALGYAAYWVADTWTIHVGEHQHLRHLKE